MTWHMAWRTMKHDKIPPNHYPLFGSIVQHIFNRTSRQGDIPQNIVCGVQHECSMTCTFSTRLLFSCKCKKPWRKVDLRPRGDPDKGYYFPQQEEVAGGGAAWGAWGHICTNTCTEHITYLDIAINDLFGKTHVQLWWFTCKECKVGSAGRQG